MKNRHWDETIKAWKVIYLRYKSLKTKGMSNADIVDKIGTSERNLYRIKKHFEN